MNHKRCRRAHREPPRPITRFNAVTESKAAHSQNRSRHPNTTRERGPRRRERNLTRVRAHLNQFTDRIYRLSSLSSSPRLPEYSSNSLTEANSLSKTKNINYIYSSWRAVIPYDPVHALLIPQIRSQKFTVNNSQNVMIAVPMQRKSLAVSQPQSTVTPPESVSPESRSRSSERTSMICRIRTD